MEEKIDWKDIYPRVNRKVRRQLHNLPISVVEEGISKATEYVLLNLERLKSEGYDIEKYLTVSSIRRSIGLWKTERKRAERTQSIYDESIHDDDNNTPFLIKDFEASTLKTELILLLSEINKEKTIPRENGNCWMEEIETILKREDCLDTIENEIINIREKFPRPSIYRLRELHLRPRLKEILNG